MGLEIETSVNKHETDEWITVQQAAERTGDSARTWRGRAAAESRAAIAAGRQSLARKAPPPGGMGRQAWWVHRSIDGRLSRFPEPRDRDRRRCDALIAKYPQHAVDRAVHRNFWLRHWRNLCAQRRDNGATDRVLAERVVAQARSNEDASFKISVRSLDRWWRVYNRIGEDGQIRGIEALIDRYDAPLVASVDSKRSPAAVTYFYDLYHTQNRLSVKLCHEATLREATRTGWIWPASYSATLGWLQKHDDGPITCLMRDGRDVWARRYLPHLQIDYTRVEPGEMYVADHHRCDFWVVYKNRQIRPWLTVVQDCRSRCIVGWHLGPAAHQDAILLALRRAFRVWAIPKVMRIDNGKDFTSKPITGVTKQERDRLRRALGADWRRVMSRDLVDCDDSRWLGITGELGIQLIYATPYAPWAKGTLERWFGTFTNQHARTYATYCGNSVLTKPECLDEIRRGYTDEEKWRLRKEHGRDWKRHAVLHLVDQRDVPTLEQARKRVGEYLDVYHHTPHSGQGMKSRTPLAVWNTAVHLRRAVDDALLCLMEVRGLYRVAVNGVTLKVGPASVGYGARCQALKRFVGQQVLIALDPDDISRCWALTPDRRKRKLIARLEPNEYVAPYTCADDAREAIAEKKREQSVMHKAARAAAQRTKTACRRINEHGEERRAELLATGTKPGMPRIEPIRTGFEGVSKGDRNGSYRPLPPREFADLLVGEATVEPNTETDLGMEDLFDDQPADVTPDVGLEELL